MCLGTIQYTRGAKGNQYKYVPSAVNTCWYLVLKLSEIGPLSGLALSATAQHSRPSILSGSEVPFSPPVNGTTPSGSTSLPSLKFTPFGLPVTLVYYRTPLPKTMGGLLQNELRPVHPTFIALGALQAMISLLLHRIYRIYRIYPLSKR